MVSRFLTVAALSCVFSQSGFAAENSPLIAEPVPAAERLLGEALPKNLDERLAFAYRLARAPSGQANWLLGSSVDSTGLRVTIRLSEWVTRDNAAPLEAVGCRLSRLPSGTLASVGHVITANCTWKALWAISEFPKVLHVGPTFDARIPRPVAPPADDSNLEMESDPLIEAMYPKPGGAGVTVADSDSGFDPFHPFMFRADGGYYAWIDADHNGIFEPWNDFVDFNRNGIADPTERLGLLKGAVTKLDWYSGASTFFNLGNQFVPGYDWLFQDANSDMARNYGAHSPYGDAVPTFGEALFLADDVNGNGKLDLNERLVRLNTPKVRAVSVPANGGLRTYRRGVDLAQVPAAGDDRAHGTMVLGTIGGGSLGLTKYHGMAPDAELLLTVDRTSSLIDNLSWAQSEGANIVLWEMATWYGEALDGSSDLELACDDASNGGILQIGAAGNLGGSQKHRVLSLPPGTQQIPLTVPGARTTYAYGNFNWHDPGHGAALAFSITVDGQTIAATGNSGMVNAGPNATVAWYRAMSPRGTGVFGFNIAGALQGQKLSAQDVVFHVTNSGSTVDLHGFVTDDYSGWSKGVFWPASTGATDFGTYGTPGDGDATLSVATYFSTLGPATAVRGALAFYSGRGPRLDGLETVDFAAREDHITAMWTSDTETGRMWIGGGTSNATPVVVGIIALLKQAHPQASPAELATMLLSQTFTEASMGTLPNDSWGHGKVRAYKASFNGTSAPVDQPPVAAGQATIDPAGALMLSPGGSTDPEGGALTFRWDVNYDGLWDTGPNADGGVLTTVPDSGTNWVKLQVADDKGRTNEVLIEMTAVDFPDAGLPDAGSPLGNTLFLPQAALKLGDAPGGCGCRQGPSGLWLLAAAIVLLRRRIS